MGTLADAAYRNLEPRADRPHSDYLRERLVGIGALEPGDTTHPRFPDMFDAPLEDGLAAVTDEVERALIELGHDRAQVAKLKVGATGDDGSLARYEPKEDGSGLVVVSDSLITLCNVYCEYTGRAIAQVTSGGLLRMFGRALLMRWTESMGEDPRLLAGVLRYHNITRRAYGFPAVLNFATRADVELHSAMFDVMLGFGLRFVVGHEAAHHVLDHRGASAPPLEQRELEADELALFAAAEALDRSFSDDMDRLTERWRREAAEFHGLLGATITMLALHTTEQALFVRRGRTHPPAEHRADQLISYILSPERQQQLENQGGRRDRRLTMRFEKDRWQLAVRIRNLSVATQLATAFDEGGTFDWAAFAASPHIEQPKPGHLDRIAALDRLMCGADAILAEEAGTGLDPEGVRLVLAGDTMNGLLAWGVTPQRVQAIHDPFCVLSFHTLVENIGLTAQPGADSINTIVAAATLVSRRIAGQTR
jgi:hypothetical protein